MMTTQSVQRIHILVGVSHGNERLKSKTEGSKLLGYTGLYGRRGFLKIETMSKGEWFDLEV
jgi:hypothetical protein